MKKLIFIILSIFIFSIILNTAIASDLSSNIMRRVNTANQALDDAEGMINQGDTTSVPGRIKTATTEYKNIFNYYKGSFDPQHPIIVALKKRIDTLSNKQKQSTSANIASQETTKTTAKVGLSSNIMRRVNQANQYLDEAEGSIKRGRAASAESSVNRAQGYYEDIFQTFKGSFDPEDPILVTLSKRIERVSDIQKKRAPVDQGLKKIRGSLEEVKRLTHMPRQMSEYLRLAKKSLKYAETIHAELLKTGMATADVNIDDFNKIDNEFATARADISTLAQALGQQAEQQNAAQSAKTQQLIQKIQTRYKEQNINTELYKNNIGKMVWSKSQITFNVQDQIKTQNRFKMTDPIFGRVYLTHSLGNAPIYSTQNPQQPSENSKFRFTYRLYIDGQEKKDKFDSFLAGKQTGDAGTSWLSWQIAPNPIPFDDGFQQEADAWRRVTKNISTGEHKIRFELWGTSGSYRTKKPLSVGEFILVVNEGDRISAGGKFPKDSYSGKDSNLIRAMMKKALIGPVAKNANEILKVAITSDWAYGTYQYTKKSYRTIMGTFLWADKDADQVCRYTSYKLISDSLGGNQWTPLRYKAFATHPEGDVDCPK